MSDLLKRLRNWLSMTDAGYNTGIPYKEIEEAAARIAALEVEREAECDARELLEAIVETKDARIAALEAERDEARKDAKAYADAAKQQREWREEADARLAELEEQGRGADRQGDQRSLGRQEWVTTPSRR